MTALQQTRRARTVLVLALAATTVLTSALIFLAGVGLAAGIDLVAALPLALRQPLVPAVVILALLAGLIRIWRGRRVARLGEVALYLEDVAPELQFALVTAVLPAGPFEAGLLDREVARTLPPGRLAGSLRRSVLPLLVATLLAGGIIFLIPRVTLARVLRPVAGDVLLPGGRAAAGDRGLGTLVVRVVPPAYSGLSEQTTENPRSVRALVGSRLTLRGNQLEGSPEVRLGQTALRVIADSGVWGVSLPMPDRPQVLYVAGGSESRVIALEPVADEAPVVRLLLPASDTTFDRPVGVVRIQATSRDDLGLDRVWIELLLTTGGGERFATSTRVLGLTPVRGAKTTELRVDIRLDTLKLGPGDVLNLRALARDRNDLTGPGEGSSDTRTLRIADPELKNDIPIVPAASATVDTTVISQRMLIIRAETLLVRRRRIPPDSFPVLSLRLAERQRMLYDRVQALILELETATDVGFVGETEESKLLRVAGVAMRRAEDELRKARVAQALPEMYKALDALDKNRTTRRLYLRGRLPRIVVDLDQVRLKGKLASDAGPRTPRPALADPRRVILARLDRVLEGGVRAAGVLDSLIVLRVDALTAAPEAAPALARVIDRLEARQDPAPAIGELRRLLERKSEARPALSRWSGPR